MSTKTAAIIAEMESAPDPQAVQGQHPTDTLFREFLRRTFDPFRQYGFTTSTELLPPIDDAEKANAALAGEWSYFLQVLDALEDNTRSEFSDSWSQSPAWPVYQRMLLKRMKNVTFEQVNGVWGDLPIFRAGKILRPGIYVAHGATLPYPLYMEPIYSGFRRLMLVTAPYDEHGGDLAVFDEGGNVKTDKCPDELLDFLTSFRYEVWLDESHAFHSGVVLDGVVQYDEAETARYIVFDVKPASKFRDCKAHEPYEKRRSLLEVLKDMITPGEDPVGVAQAVRCETNAQLVKAARDARKARTRTTGLVVKSAGMSYPHKGGDAWLQLETENG